MDQMGVCFVGFVGQYGYDRVLSVLGRHMRDFLNGLDNLHEYLKFSYPRMKAPSFICENETKQGLTLHYRSKRRGFVYYTMGQIREVCIRLIYTIDLAPIYMDTFMVYMVAMSRDEGTWYIWSHVYCFRLLVISTTRKCTSNWLERRFYLIRFT